MSATLEDEIAAEMGDDDTDDTEGTEGTEPESDDDTESDAAEAAARSGPTEDVVMEDAFKKIAARAKTYASAVSSLLGEHALELALCPLCTEGPTPMFVNLHDAGRVPDPIVDNVKVYLGFAREQDYKASSETQTCGTCEGRGKVMTGSHVPGNETAACPNCKGYGYTPPPGAGAPAVAAVVAPHAPAGEAAVPVSDPDIDTLGEPRILPDGRPNPNFQKWPQYKVHVDPWGVTAGLTAQDAAAA
jgi:hypothetical protein